jgi:monoamine oxidase
MGWVTKVHCVYSTRFWEQQGLSGAMTSDEGAIQEPYSCASALA